MKEIFPYSALRDVAAKLTRGIGRLVGGMAISTRPAPCGGSVHPRSATALPGSEDITQEALVQQAMRVESTDLQEAIRIYSLIKHRYPMNLEAHNALERLNAPNSLTGRFLFDCTIDPRDDIYHFFASSPIACDPIRAYLSDGWRTLSELLVLLEEANIPLTYMDRVLEFACGYGRFSRHLAKALPGRVTCSDILPGSVDFVRDRFGVDGFYSCHDPSRIVFPKRYDLVFVLSLFTHLPTDMWLPWLRSLGRAVTPGGVLLFTVHSEAAGTSAGISFSEDGTCFIPHSESPSLSVESYGTTYTTRQAAEKQVRFAFEKEPLLYKPTAFWNGQDAILVQL